MAVGEEGTYLTSLTFDSYSVNTGGGYKASFVFEGFDGDMTGCFTANSTWPVNASSTTGPKCKVLDENSAVVAGLTGKTITSDTIAPSQYQGTLDIYPLSAGSYTIEYYDDTSTLVGSESFVVANTNPKMKDLASGVLVNSVSASATSLVVNVGSGTDAEIKGVWPDTPFYITAMPANPSAGVPNSLDSEIMKVSAVGTDGSGNTTLSVARAQRGSTAQAFSAGAVITNASYADDAVVWGEETSPENPSPWITPDMMTDEAKREIAEDTAVLGYINYTRATLPSGWFPVYKDSAHTTTYPYDEIYSAVEAGLSVVFRTTDNYDMRILGLFSTTDSADYYTVAYDGNTLGMLTYDKSMRLTWHYGAGAVLSDEIADGAVTTTKINSKAVTNAKIADNTIQNGKIDWNGFFEEVSGTYSTAWKFPDGKMIVFGAKYNGYSATGSYEGSYYTSTGDNLTNVFAATFYAAPKLIVTLEYNSGLLGFTTTGISTTGFSGYIWKAQSKSNMGVTVHFIAIGRWKA